MISESSLVIRWLRGIALLTPLTLSSALAAQPLFVDVRDAAGVGGDTYNTLTDHGLGVDWIDYNRDTWPDLFVTNGKGSSPHLFRNDGDGTFTKVDELLGDLPDVEMMGAVFADIDNDGDEDIYVFTDYPAVGARYRGGPPNLLLENRWADNGGRVLPGEPLFREVAAVAGVEDLLPVPEVAGPGYRAPTGAFLDYDRDGYVDLFVCHWLGFSEGREGDPNLRERLYRNNGDGTFLDVTASSGVDLGDDPSTRRPCLAAIAAHLDDDLWPDIWVGNIHLPLPFQLDRILQNQGDDGSSCADDHCFIDRQPDSPGVGDDDSAAMGITVGDIESDGDWDVYVSDLFEYRDAGTTPFGNPLYLGTGNGIVFQDNSAEAAGVMGSNSWGVNFFDADQDGHLDLFVGTTGDIRTDHFYHGNQDGTFTDVARDAGFFASRADSRGSAVADFDHDGDLDLAVVNQLGPLQLFKNTTSGAGHWLQVRLVGTESNTSALGSVVRVTAGGRQLMRQVIGGSSAHSQDGLVVHFGLGDATVVDHLQILWPSGLVSDLFDQPADSSLTVVENGTGNQAPVVTITGPVGGTVVDEGGAVTFVGMATDPEDGDLTTGLSWTSDVDGVIGSGASFSTSALSKGTHVITAEVADTGGTGGAYLTTLIVGNATPWVTISSPADGASFFQGSTVELAATAMDLEDGDLSASLSWTSDLDGTIGGGGTFAMSTLSPGAHLITASVVDSSVLSASDAIAVTIEPLTTVVPSSAKLVVTQKKTGWQKLSASAKDTATLASMPCAVDGELLIEAIGSGMPPKSFPLPANLWTPIKAKKPELGCKCGPGGVVRKILLKQGKMLALSAAAADLVPLTADPWPMRIQLRHGTTRHCLEFVAANGSLKPDKKLVAKQTGPATACPNGS